LSHSVTPPHAAARSVPRPPAPPRDRAPPSRDRTLPSWDDEALLQGLAPPPQSPAARRLAREGKTPASSKPVSGLGRYWKLAVSAVKNFSTDRATVEAAALSYYTVFSLAPLLLIVIGIAGFIFGRDAVAKSLVEQAQGLVGEQGAQLIETVLQNATKPANGAIAAVVGVVTLILGASGVFGQLKDSLNKIWQVEPQPGRGLWTMLRTRILSFAMVLVIAFLLLVSLVVSAILAAVGAWAGKHVPWAPLFHALDLAVSLGVIGILFAIIFKYLPDARIGWREVGIGALTTAALFTVGKFLIGLYLGKSSVASVYGAAGSVIIILLWVYYSALIFLVGAELTRVHADMLGKRIQPAPHARRTRAACEPSVRGPAMDPKPA
jgi:membrane protein